MRDRIRVMQKALDKSVQKKAAASSDEAKKMNRTGLLAPRGGMKEDVKASGQKDMMAILADYIDNIRKQKEEILNGK